jgi:hypothetical protein
VKDLSDPGLWQLRLERLEAESAIRHVMARYMRFCDRLDESTPIDELAALFTRDAVWAGRGNRYQALFGEHRGREAIREMLDGYRGPPPLFVLNAHFLTSEQIDTTSNPASGCWMMLQTSTYADGTSELRCARLACWFTVEDDRWRICRFETENLFARPIDRWDVPPGQHQEQAG